MFKAGAHAITIAETAQFESDARAIFTDAEYQRLILFLAHHPDAGDLVPETGGVRKLRWAARGQGKRGGARVIYYFRDINVPVYLLAAYAKGEKINLTAAEKKAMRGMIDDIVEANMTRRGRMGPRS